MIGFRIATIASASARATSRINRSVMGSGVISPCVMTPDPITLACAPADVSRGTASEPGELEEALVARLRTEVQDAARAHIERPPHQLASDAVLPELGVDHHFRNRVEEVAVRQHTHRADETVAAPGTYVDRRLQGRCGL